MSWTKKLSLSHKLYHSEIIKEDGKSNKQLTDHDEPITLSKSGVVGLEGVGNPFTTY